MEMEIIGLKHFAFNRKSDNKPLEGYEVHLSYDDKYWDGFAGEIVTFWIDQVERAGRAPRLGDKIQVFYDKRGKVSGFTYLS